MIESPQERTASVYQINKAEPSHYVKDINCNNDETFNSSDSDRPPEK